MSKLANILVIPDSHHPYADARAAALALAVAKHLKPQIIVFIGDFVDCYAISAHEKDPARSGRLQQEVDTARKELHKYDGLSDSRVLLEGNHEFRLLRYLGTRAPELYGLVEMHELLGLQRREYIPYRRVHTIGKMAFSHDFGYAGKTAAQQSLEAYGGNICFGHTHRGAVVYDGNTRGERHVALNVGWLGSLKHIDYMHTAQTRAWQHGVGLVQQDSRGTSYASFMPFVRGTCNVLGTQVRV